MTAPYEHPHSEPDLEVGAPKDAAAGLTGVAVALERAVRSMGPVRATKTLRRLNQVDGLDCPSCAWPDPEHRSAAEFCENGAKAVAEEATKKRATPELFAGHSIADLDAHDELWLGQQGRITHPMVKRPGATHYEPIGWNDAFALVADHLAGLDSPDQAAFYTSGRASNEAAYAYQLFVRAFGTNNLPDCSNMCHESTSVALGEAIGVGKGSVQLRDLYDAELIVIAGQNPGTNHPRMLSALETAKRRGAKILAINPLKETGLVSFKNPQKPRGIVGHGTPLADLHLPVRVNGDLALFQAFGALLLEWDAIDHDFVARHTVGYEEWAAHVRAIDWDVVETATGLTRAEITEAAQMLRSSSATIWCWAMGLTQHRNSVATIKEIVNLALVRGDLGRRGAGLCPVRGHSNVQGDRSMGIWERPPQHFLDALATGYDFEPPREPGFDTVDTVRAMRDGIVKVFFALGGNFVHAAPDTNVTADALRRTDLTVHVSTKLNRSHLVCGTTALILPTLGRTEIDRRPAGEQHVTVEDSMSVVHASRGALEPASDMLLSETAIVSHLAEETLTRWAAAGHSVPSIDWKAMRDDYRVVRQHIAAVVPGCDGYEVNTARQGGYVMPHPPRDSLTFPNPEAAGVITVSPIEVLHVPDRHLLLQTLRSHDQFNTTIYGLSDRYRGIEGGRRVVFVHREDIATLGFDEGEIIDLVSVAADGSLRRAPAFRIVGYDVPRGTAAAYYPETNPLVPLDSVALGSNTPTSKSVVVRLERRSTH